MRIVSTKNFKNYFNYRYAIESYGLGTVHIYDSAETGESEVTGILECIGVPAGIYSDSGRITVPTNIN